MLITKERLKKQVNIMMTSLNNVCIFRGYLASNPKLSYYDAQDGSKAAMARLSLAVRNGFDKDSATFLPMTVFGKQAETLCQNASKGTQLLVGASIRQSSFFRGDKKEYRLEIIVNSYEYLSYAKGNSDSETSEDVGDEDTKGKKK